jgi:hypothetical protein
VTIALIEIPRHQWEGVGASEDIAMVEAETTRDHIEQAIDALFGSANAFLKRDRVDLRK